jgi:hypothetical protein
VLVNHIVIGTSAADRVTFTGPAGSVRPDIVRVTGRNLETADPPSTVEVNGDGAFQITLAGQVTDEYRLVAEFEGSHSAPVDLVGPGDLPPRCLGRDPGGCEGYVDQECCLIDSSCVWEDESCGPAVPWTEATLCESLGDEVECHDHPGCFWASGDASVPVRALPECLDLEPRRWISFGARSRGSRSAISIEVTNDCAEAVSLRLSFRAGEPTFSLAGAIPGEELTLERGDGLDIDVAFEPGDEGFFEDLVFVEILEPPAGRWPISLWGEGVP